MLKRRVRLQIIQKLRRRIGRGDEQVVAGAGAGDVEELAFGVVDVSLIILRLVQLVEAHARIRRIELQVEGRRLDRLLLVAGQFEQAVVEGAGKAEVHGSIRSALL